MPNPAYDEVVQNTDILEYTTIMMDNILGTITAYIPGDMRYYDQIVVNVKQSDLGANYVRVCLKSYGPLGGMDSFTATALSSTNDIQLPITCTGADIVRAVKRLSEGAGCCIKRYGKPSKNFKWSRTGARGLSAKNAEVALREFRGSHWCKAF